MEFEYLIIDKNGNRVKASMEAESEAEVSGILRKDGSVPLKIKPKKDQAGLFDKLFSRETVTIKDKIIFTRQLGTVLSAGVLLSEALETIAEEMENEYFAGVIQSVLSDIHAGQNFSTALYRHPSVFSSYYIAIISAGEMVGNLATTVTSLAGFMEDNERMRQKFIAAVRYPIFLLCFVFLIVSAIVLFLIPKFKAIFDGAGIPLPALTRAVVALSEFSLHYLVFIILGMAALIFAAWRALRNFKVRYMVDYAILRLPGVGKFIRRAIFAQFCHTLAMLLKGGVNVITSLTLSAKVAGNSYLTYIFVEVREAVTGGSALSKSLGAHEDVPRIMVRMVAVGEKSGKLDDMLKRVANYYDQEVEIFLNNIHTLLEPIFIIFIGIIVLIVALALYLPIFKISAAVH